MPISLSVISLIRDEIGNDLDFSDQNPPAASQLDSLENIYTDANRGNFSPLVTALICWRRRLHHLQTRSFDVTTEGSLLSRNQRIRLIERNIKRLELLVDDTAKGRNMEMATPLATETALEGAELS